MTINEFLRRFPNASKSAIAANCSDSARTPAVVERGPGVKPLAAPQAEEKNMARYVVRYTSVRKRLLDTDNLHSKTHTDWLRRNGYIPNDDPATVTIETRQRKCEPGEPERIEIVIERLP